MGYHPCPIQHITKFGIWRRGKTAEKIQRSWIASFQNITYLFTSTFYATIFAKPLIRNEKRDSSQKLFYFFLSIFFYFLCSVGNPVNELGSPGINTWVSGSSTASSPGNDSAVLAVTGHGSTRVYLAGVPPLFSRADHAISDGSVSISSLAV